MSNPTFTITRTFNTTADKLWQAWTTPEDFQHWFGPKGFSTQIKRFEFFPGGVLLSCLTAPDGQHMWGKFIYCEITPKTYLAWEHGFADEQGNRARHPLHAAWPLTLLTTITFKSIGANTSELTLTWTPFNALPEEIKTFSDNMDSMTQGWTGTFEQLEDFLAKQ